MLIGAHVSVSKGYLAALDYAESVGAECFQFFAKSPRQWHGRPVDAENAEAFRAERAARGTGPVFTHTAYLINLGTDDAELLERSIAALADEIVRGASLGASGVVTHLGNDPLGDTDAAAVRIGAGIVHAFELAGDAGAGARLLVENTAGAGRSFGGSLAELGQCVAASGLPAERLGVCLDTCHAFAYGMPLDSAEGWREVLGEFERTCGLDRLGLIHGNDCKFERGSKRDRHEWIGEGFIGEPGFRAMVCEPQLAHVALCMEMPGEVPIKDSGNIDRLKRYRSECSARPDVTAVTEPV